MILIFKNDPYIFEKGSARKNPRIFEKHLGLNKKERPRSLKSVNEMIKKFDWIFKKLWVVRKAPLIKKCTKSSLPLTAPRYSHSISWMYTCASVLQKTPNPISLHYIISINHHEQNYQSKLFK